MEKRVAVMGIIVENTESVSELNALLHEYGEFIVGRMGIPYKEKNINIMHRKLPLRSMAKLWCRKICLPYPSTAEQFLGTAVILLMGKAMNLMRPGA